MVQLHPIYSYSKVKVTGQR